MKQIVRFYYINGYPVAFIKKKDDFNELIFVDARYVIKNVVFGVNKKYLVRIKRGYVAKIYKELS